MAEKKILMAACNYWESPFQVGSHNIAKAFVQNGWKVAFISDPVSMFHYLKKNDPEISARLKNNKEGGKWDLNNKVWAYVPFALITPFNSFFLKSLFVLKNWYRWSVPFLKNKLRQKGFDKVDLIYIDSTYQSFFLDIIEYEKAFFRIADKNSGFSKFTSQMETIEKMMARKVDLIIYSAKNLEHSIDVLDPKEKRFIPNGVNFAHFSKGNKSKPIDFQNIPRPIAVYVGAISNWFDFNLVNFAAEHLPHISFVIIGNKNQALMQLEQNKNVFILGTKNYSELPGYLYNSDVGIIPFNLAENPDLVNSINPLKMYEYMACGLPVVSVEWDELKNLNSPAILAKTYEEFTTAIQNIISGEIEMNKSVLQKYAESNDWKQRINKFISDLDIK